MNEEIEKNPIKAAVRLSKKASAQEIEDASIERGKAIQVLSKIEQLETTLLPIEQGMRSMVISAKKKAVQKVKQFESLDKLNRYPVFDLEPLTWRDNNGLPCLAVFNITSPNFELTAINRSYNGSRNWKQEIKPELPQDMRECFKDILNKLLKTAKEKRKNLTLRARYAGFIPPEIKIKILKAAKEFKDIYIIAQINQWDFEQTAIPKLNKDPLVIGYDGINYWLIAAFYPTNLEKIVSQRYSIKHKKELKAIQTGQKALPPGSQN